MDGVIVKLRCKNDTKYYLPLTSGQAVILDNGMTLEAEIASFVKTSEINTLIRNKILLQSPNGTIFEISIDDTGKIQIETKGQHIDINDFMFLDNSSLDVCALGGEDINLDYLSLDTEKLNGSKIG